MKDIIGIMYLKSIMILSFICNSKNIRDKPKKAIDKFQLLRILIVGTKAKRLQ